MRRIKARAGSLVCPSAERDFILDRGIATALAAREHARCSQNLWTVADRRNRLIAVREMLNDLQHSWIQPQVLRRTTSWQHQRVVRTRLDRIKVRVERETMPWLFAIGLVSSEVLDRRSDIVSTFFAGANAIAMVPDHQQHLIGNHDLVILDKIPHHKQDSLCRHGLELFPGILNY